MKNLEIKRSVNAMGILKGIFKSRDKPKNATSGTDSVPSFCMVILFISIILIIWHSRQSRHGTKQSAVRCMYVALQNSLSFRLHDGERRSDSVPEQSPANR